jgi:hypothetical protein
MAVDTEKKRDVAEAVSKSGVPESFKPRPIPEVYPSDVNWNIVYHRIQVGQRILACHDPREVLADERGWGG